MEELFARLEVIERLLKLSLSKPEYAGLIENEKANVYREYGEQLNSMFPSDPDYQRVKLPFDLFNQAADDILFNIKHLPIGS